MSEYGRRGLDALAIAAAPVVILMGVIIRPYQEDFTDRAEFARLVDASSTRWAWSHVVLGLGMALLVLAVFALRHHLRDQGEDAWSFVAVSFFAVGGGLLAFCAGAGGLGAWAAGEGGSSLAFAEAIEDWAWLYRLAVGIFSVGMVLLATAVAKAALVGGLLRQVVVWALVITVITNFIPTGWALYAAGILGVVAFWGLAWAVVAGGKATKTAEG